MDLFKYVGLEPKTPVPDNHVTNFIQDGAWEGRRCFVVAGGPSLKGFNWSRLRGELVVGINRAYEFCDPTIIMSMDSRWYAWASQGRYGRKARDRFAGWTHGHKVLSSREPHGVPGVLWARQTGLDEPSASLNLGLGNGSNSGFSAVNLACLLVGKTGTVYLLGFDMNSTGGKQTWHHDGHPEVQKASVYDRFRAKLEGAAGGFNKMCRIVNLNPASALKSFEFGSIEDVRPISRPVFVSYATPEYHGEQDKLNDSMKAFGLLRDLRHVDSLGSWDANTSFKPTFLKRMHDAYPDDAIFYLDSDARIKAYPGLLDDFGGCDVAVHYRDWGRRRPKELLSGSIWLAPGQRRRDFLDLWEKECQANPGLWDQAAMDNALKANPGFKVKELPAAYCAIFDAAMCPNGTEVILHTQASRKLKKVVGAHK